MPPVITIPGRIYAVTARAIALINIRINILTLLLSLSA
jgi:hypothetical protein